MNQQRILKSVWLLVPAAVLVISVIVMSSTSSAPPRANQHGSDTSLHCQDSPNFNDYQMNMCLTAQVRVTRSQLKGALDREAAALQSGSIQNGQRVVHAAESAYERYVRAECLAEANPYSGGTIYPIIFGNCEVSLLQERLALVNQQLKASLAN
ncbi:MAG TPA: lysozyme inhibitor LprI family protein [Acidimicrobiales bacterium]|nr:lysozyme inhibitor LprI family protein [Acidimicrobiales bacterium]